MSCCGHCDMLCSDIAIKVFLSSHVLHQKTDTTLCKRLRKLCGEYAYFKENVAIGYTFRSLAVCSEHHSQCLLLHLQVIGQGRKETKISLNFKY